jgi:hypothetical protein
MPRSDLVQSASALCLLVKGSIPTVESCPIQIANMLRLLLLLGEMALPLGKGIDLLTAFIYATPSLPKELTFDGMSL